MGLICTLNMMSSILFKTKGASRRRVANIIKSHISMIPSPNFLHASLVQYHSRLGLGYLLLCIFLPNDQTLDLFEHALRGIHQCTESETPLLDADGVDEEVDEDPVGDAECEEDAQVY